MFPDLSIHKTIWILISNVLLSFFLLFLHPFQADFSLETNLDSVFALLAVK